MPPEWRPGSSITKYQTAFSFCFIRCIVALCYLKWFPLTFPQWQRPRFVSVLPSFCHLIPSSASPLPLSHWFPISRGYWHSIVLDVSSQVRPGNKRFELSTCMKYCMRPQSSFFFEDVEAVENWVNSCPLTRLVGRNHRHDAFGSRRPWGWKMIQSSGCQLPTNQQPNNHPASLLHIHYVTISNVLSIIHFLMVCRW